VAVTQTQRRPAFGLGQWGVHGWAWFTLLATLVLLGSGGLVTSKGVGMAVPDWPTTYGYNMFLFPVSKWVGGIFYEHTHRLIASAVGVFTIILCVWLWVVDARRWVKLLGTWALVAVIIQGLLGGLRVTMFKDEIGIFHGILAQLFFCTLGSLVIFTSPWFVRGRFFARQDAGLLRWAAVALSALILVQLAVGASMRHAHSGLAIPDFPLAYGALWPDTSAATVEQLNTERLAEGVPPTTPAQIILQMKHRLLALAIVLGVGWFAWRARRSRDRVFARWAALWFFLIVGQATLGAWTIWSNKAADVATAHVVLGALCLLTGAMLALRQFFSFSAQTAAAAPSPVAERPQSPSPVELASA
jgi:cytochrome c oxidase assembly protein subunit 15